MWIGGLIVLYCTVALKTIGLLEASRLLKKSLLYFKITQYVDINLQTQNLISFFL